MRQEWKVTTDLLGHCIVYSATTGKPPHALKTWPLILSSTALTYNLAVAAAVTAIRSTPQCPENTSIFIGSIRVWMRSITACTTPTASTIWR